MNRIVLLRRVTFNFRIHYWLLFLGGEDVFAEHEKFLLIIRARVHFNSGGVEHVVGDVDEPGAEETGPANSQHDTDVVRGQIMGIAVDVLDSHSVSDIQSSMNGQTEKIIMINIIIWES